METERKKKEQIIALRKVNGFNGFENIDVLYNDSCSVRRFKAKHTKILKKTEP